MAEINLSPYTAESEAIARRIKMAELLQQQSMQPLETPGMAGGYQLAISPYAGLAKILQGYTAGQAGRSAEAERKALGDRYQSDLISTLNRANQLSLGKPAVPEGAFKPEAADFQDNPNLALKNEMGVIPAVPAVAPNPEAAAREYFKHPATQAMGMNQLQKIAQTQQFINAGNAGNAPSGTSAPVAGVTPATSTSGSTVVPLVGSKPLASALANFGGPAGGQSMQAWLQVDPSGKTYLEQLAKDFSETNKPTDKIRELRAAGVPEGSPQWNAALTDVAMLGGIWRRNAQGDIKLAPGFATGTAEIKTAEEEAKAVFDLVDVSMPGGGLQKMTRADAVKYLQRTPAQPTTNPQGEITGIPVQDIGKATKAGIIVNTPANKGIGFTADPATQAGDKTRTEKRATNEVAREEQLLRTGYQEAQSMINNLDLMQSLASDPNVAQGKLADQISGLKSVAQSLGIRTEGLPAEEAIRAISVEMALKAKNQGGTNLMPGSMAVAETQMLQSMTPQLAQSREGRNLLIQVFRQKALRDQKISELATDYYDRNGKLDYNFEKEVRAFAKANPMFSDNQMQAIKASLKILSEKK